MILFALVAGSVAGCATPIDTGGCAPFTQRRSGSPATQYRYLETETRNAARAFRAPARGQAPIQWYTLRLNLREVQPCDQLYIYKDLYVARDTTALALEEHREFYTSAGRLIAVKKESIGDQLQQRGYYTASVALPIPESAPAGRYRVVSKLVAKHPNGKERVLASANAEFRVVDR